MSLEQAKFLGEGPDNSNAILGEPRWEVVSRQTKALNLPKGAIISQDMGDIDSELGIELAIDVNNRLFATYDITEFVMQIDATSIVFIKLDEHGNEAEESLRLDILIQQSLF